ncbi:hypothetical protein CHH28_04245 [Bacterioplanes sanyensis]|uniref:TM2 domain-containing protein n=1 Tax=Bacterioplanes sanyensis TaxID=1249553 RepID=A0A222FFT4_9GAMM|nr:hypothetical protein [Bacterioplanes sanyensis]ASP37935.1 hypothetical protein CHH28_04245 [Bacterioplanes sanyensis]
MASQQLIDEEEERIRQLVRKLPDEQRASFYRQTEQQLKDPDTYATLNYIFIAGLHHFYLGKWTRGIINIVIFWLGVALLFSPLLWLGILVIIAISVFELYELFRAQRIVQEHNNALMLDIYQQIKST